MGPAGYAEGKALDVSFQGFGRLVNHRMNPSALGVALGIALGIALGVALGIESMVLAR
jgi:hypothetical protein